MKPILSLKRSYVKVCTSSFQQYSPRKKLSMEAGAKSPWGNVESRPLPASAQKEDMLKPRDGAAEAEQAFKPIDRTMSCSMTAPWMYLGRGRAVSACCTTQKVKQ